MADGPLQSRKQLADTDRRRHASFPRGGEPIRPSSESTIGARGGRAAAHQELTTKRNSETPALAPETRVQTQWDQTWLSWRPGLEAGNCPQLPKTIAVPQQVMAPKRRSLKGHHMFQSFSGMLQHGFTEEQRSFA